MTQQQHDLDQFDMHSSDEGEMVIPSEVGNLSTPATLRQFMVLSSRLFSTESLEKNASIKLRYNPSLDDDYPTENPEFLYVNLLAKPNDIQAFTQQEGDKFFEKVLEIVGTSHLRGMRGKRGAFVGAFEKVTQGYTEMISSKILLSTTVFFNDYRATVGYPYTEVEMQDVIGEIYSRLQQEYPLVQFELSYESLQEEDDEVFSGLY